MDHILTVIGCLVACIVFGMMFSRLGRIADACEQTERNTSRMKRLMTGETTPEAERKGLVAESRQRNEVEARKGQTIKDTW